MRDVKIKVYQYHELSEKAKEKARDWWIAGDDGEWAWDNVKEDASNVGLVVTSLSLPHANEGSFEVSALDACERILKEHGASCETYKTAAKHIDALRKFSADDDAVDELHDTEHEFLHDILEDYRVMLEKEIEHQQSEEYIAEVMEANKYEFTEEGERFRVKKGG